MASNLIGELDDQDIPDRDLDEGDMIDRIVNDVNGWFSYFNENIQAAREDIYFAMVNQWDPELYAIRTENNKACMQFNYIYSVITSLIGEFRKQTPEYKVYAMANETNPKVNIDQDMIDLVDGIIRQISFDNKMELVFQQAFESQLLRGFGAVFVNVEYENDMSFNQVPKVVAYADPLMCYFDPNAKVGTKSDGNFCGYRIPYTWSEFKDKFPNSKYAEDGTIPTSFPSSEVVGQQMTFFWKSKEMVWVACDWRKESYPVTIALLSDGRTMKLDEAEEEVAKARSLANRVKRKENKLRGVMKTLGFDTNDNSAFDDYEHLSIVDTRDTIDYKIINRIVTDDEILEESEWPSNMLPGVFFDGHSQVIDGRQITKSFHRTAKDAQKMLNYLGSESLENLMNSHKEQWIGTPDNFNGYLQEWRDPSLSKGVLIANLNERGELPQQVAPPSISPNFIQLFQQSVNDIKGTLGYFESNIGAQGGETSGRMVTERAKQGSLANFVYFDNAEQGIDQTYQVIMSLIPNLMDTTRNIVIRNKTGEQRNVTINKPNGDDYENDLTNGKYGIEVTVGSNFEIQKQENLLVLKDLAATLAPSNPEVVGGIADLYAANTNLENTTQIVDRIRQITLGKTPAEILREEMGLPPEDKKPNPQMQEMQMKMQVEQMDQQNKAKELEIKAQELQLQAKELDLKRMQLMSDMQKNQISADKNKVEIYKADKSLEEIRETTDTERYNSDKDVEIERVKAMTNMHKSALDAHKSSADIHVAHLQGLHASNNKKETKDEE